MRCSCSSKVIMLMKLAIENTEMDRDVSLRITRRGWVRWYRTVSDCYCSIRPCLDVSTQRSILGTYSGYADPGRQKKLRVLDTSKQLQDPRHKIRIDRIHSQQPYQSR